MVLDLSKVNPRRILIDAYSPHTYPRALYYSHSIETLPIGQDWVRRGSAPVVPLSKREPPAFDESLIYKHLGKRRTLAQFMERSNVIALVVLKDDQIVFERMLYGSNAASRFMSNSVCKSILGLLMGVALRDGVIESLDDPVTRYIPELSRTGFQGRTVRDLLTMRSNVPWNETYEDANADINDYMVSLWSGDRPLSAYVFGVKPDTGIRKRKFNYQSVNSMALVMLLERVYGQKLNAVLEGKVWKHLGAERDAFYFRGMKQSDVAGAGSFAATIHDYARLGLLVANQGKANGVDVVPREWIRTIVERGPETDDTGIGDAYNMTFWFPDKGKKMKVLEGLGIFGQFLYIDVEEKVVIVQFSAWRKSWDPELEMETYAAYRSIVKRLSGGE